MTCSKCGELFLSDGPFRSGYAYPKPMCFDCKAVLPRDERHDEACRPQDCDYGPLLECAPHFCLIRRDKVLAARRARQFEDKP